MYLLSDHGKGGYRKLTAGRTSLLVPTGYAEPLPPSQRWFRYFSFSKCCFPRCVSQTKHFCNPQHGSKIAQSWGVWDLLHSVPKIKAIQVVNTILWVLWACWVSQSLSKLLLPNKLCKTSECFEVCGWTVQCGGSFTYCCLPPKPLKQGEEKSLSFLGSEGRLCCELEIEAVPCHRYLQTQLSEHSCGFFSALLCWDAPYPLGDTTAVPSNPSPFSVLKRAVEHLCP